MAEFFYTNINFEEEKPFVDHMNKIPSKEAAEKLGFVSGHDFSRAVNE